MRQSSLSPTLLSPSRRVIFPMNSRSFPLQGSYPALLHPNSSQGTLLMRPVPTQEEWDPEGENSEGEVATAFQALHKANHKRLCSGHIQAIITAKHAKKSKSPKRRKSAKQSQRYLSSDSDPTSSTEKGELSSSKSEQDLEKMQQYFIPPEKFDIICKKIVVTNQIKPEQALKDKPPNKHLSSKSSPKAAIPQHSFFEDVIREELEKPDKR